MVSLIIIIIISETIKVPGALTSNNGKDPKQMWNKTTLCFSSEKKKKH